MFPHPCILVMGQVEKFDNFLSVCKVTIICHTVEFVIEFRLGFEDTTVDRTKGIPRLENVAFRLEVTFKGI